MGISGPWGRGLRAAVGGTVSALVLALLPGCGPQDGPWAERALQWIEARDHAAHRSVVELQMFESPDSVRLLCCNQDGPFRGREANAAFMAREFGDSVDEGRMGRSYIDVTGAVVEFWVAAGPDGSGPSGAAEPVVRNELQVSEHAPDGTATRTIHAVALNSLRSMPDGIIAYYADALADARSLTDRYLSAWSSEDGLAIGQLYAENAMLLDSVLGVRLTGRAAIGSYATGHGGAWLGQEPIGDGPALYGYWREDRSHLTAYLTYTGEDGNRCPGGVTTELQVEQGHIVAERRYHDVASVRRCVEEEKLPDGWWTHAVIPAPSTDRVTGTVTAEGQRIEIHNGNPGANDLVRWAMARFPAAHLTAPTIDSVALTEEANESKCSSGSRGLAMKIGSSTRIYLCYAVDLTAPPFARELLLHELAHAWMWTSLDEARQRQFLASMHLATWDRSDVPREQRGIEQAADVIAWGLADEPLQKGGLASRSCAENAEAFRLLTRVTPLQPPCPPSG